MSSVGSGSRSGSGISPKTSPGWNPRVSRYATSVWSTLNPARPASTSAGPTPIRNPSVNDAVSAVKLVSPKATSAVPVPVMPNPSGAVYVGDGTVITSPAVDGGGAVVERTAK